MGDATCKEDGCARKRWARGWCTNHYQLWRRNGAPVVVKGSAKPCAVDACDRNAKTRGWCGPHYLRWRANGDPGTDAIKTKTIRVRDGAKLCGQCGTWKPLADFNKHPHGSGGVGASCRLCLAAASRAWRAAHPGYIAAWREANADVQLDYVHRRRAAREAVPAERVLASEVYERDRFVCMLCGGALDMTAKAPHPLSPSLDHVVPLSRGGAHVMENVQASHFYCNASKGDREAPLSAPPPRLN